MSEKSFNEKLNELENKSKTIIERFGFKDKDLTTPEHDKILLMILENPKQFLEKSTFEVNSKVIIDRIAKNRFKQYGYHDSDSKYVYAILKKECFEPHAEYPIMSNQYNVGFIDCMIIFQLEFEVWSKIDRVFDNQMNSKIVNKSHILYNHETYLKNFLIEIKPEVQSIGELIRQINLYRSHRKGVYIVATKTKGLTNVLNSQNIWVIEL